MSKHRVLSLKPQLRLERQRQDGQNEMKQSGHSASLCDSITPSTQTRFSVQTTPRKPLGFQRFEDFLIGWQIQIGRPRGCDG
jgi:hypothetical protein